MDENGISTIGRNVALYRRALKMSAEDLAETVGMTRSVVANLENGRKDDVTVKQLVALASALGVPPVALAVDINDPAGEPDFTIDERQVEDYDFTTGETRMVTAHFRNHEAMNWFAGYLVPQYDTQTAAQRMAYDSLGALANYSRSFTGWLRMARQIDELRRERGRDPESFTEGGREDLLYYLEDQFEDAALQLAGWVATCRRAGVRINNTGARVASVMRGLGFEPPVFEDMGIDG